MRLTSASQWFLPRPTDRAGRFLASLGRNLLEHEPVGKRIQSCKFRQVYAVVREELSDLPLTSGEFFIP